MKSVTETPPTGGALASTGARLRPITSDCEESAFTSVQARRGDRRNARQTAATCAPVPSHCA